MHNRKRTTIFNRSFSFVFFTTAALFLSLLWVTPASLEAAVFACGADVSWLPQMEAQGTLFYNDAGVQEDCLQILKEHGINSIRLRVWVNPSADRCAGHCSRDETVAMAKRAAGMGFRIMIDFHYSDSWADPGKQTKPAAWSSHTISQLATDVYNHTTDVLNAVITAGVHPEWVQVGNETNDGMLWNDGRASSSFANFTSLVNSGYNAVKATDSAIKVIIHISNGYDNSLFRWMFDGLTANNARYDIIGMSLYPTTSNWSTLTSQCLTNMNDMVTRYGKEVMIAEVGMASSAAQATKDMLTDLISKVKSVSNGKGLGVFYWEPQCYNWCSYSLGAWNTNGRPTIAMDAFLTGTGTGFKTSSSIMKSGPMDISFNPLTSAVSVCYQVPEDGFVSLTIFDFLGKEVAAIVHQSMQSGIHTATWNAGGCAAGTYFFRMRINDRTSEVKRFLQVR